MLRSEMHELKLHFSSGEKKNYNTFYKYIPWSFDQ